MKKMENKYDILSEKKIENDDIENYEVIDMNIYTDKFNILKNIFKIFLFLLLIFIIIYPFNNKKDEPTKKETENTQVYFEGKKAYFTKETIDKFNKYMDTCLKGNLFDNKIYNISSSPKISVVMPLYNAKNYLYYSLRSIQNQNMKDIEIILINDCSTDNTLELIKKYMKEDPRIRLINNEENRRILYSKSLGALYANGKYIILLDQDDMFIGEEAFDSLYNKAEEENIDLIQFQDKLVKKFNFPNKVDAYNNQWILHHEDTYLYQPNIKNNYFGDYNFLLWGLLIKSDCYKKAVNILWPIIINYKIIHFEDYTMTSMILIQVKKFFFMNKHYIVHLRSKDSTGGNKKYLKEKNLCHLLAVNLIYEFHVKNNPNDYKMIYNVLLKLNINKNYKNDLDKAFIYIIGKAINILPYKEKKAYLDKYKLKDFKIWNTYEYFMNKNEYNQILNYQNIITSKTKKNIKTLSSNPMFSIIIYSQEYKFLSTTINSIQNQIYDDFEIILIYDSINQTDLEQIYKLIEDYSNIIFIDNQESKGLLHSISVAVLQSNGKYILTIENGYTLSNELILKNINDNINNNIDILEINLIINNEEIIKNISLNLYRCNHFKSEINDDMIRYNKNYKKIMLQYISFFDEKIVYNYFDEIILFLLNKNNIKINHINLNGIIQYSEILKNFDYKNNNTQLVNDSLFYINFLFDNSNKDEKSINFVLYEYYNIFSIIYNKFNYISNEAIELLYKFLNCKYISTKDKNLLKIYYNALVDRNIYDLI